MLQTHLKERLTGAALLVLIVVLLVPEMFRGRPTSAPQPASAAPEGPPVRSYTIDLRDNDGARPLPAGAPLSAGTPLTAGTAGSTDTPPASPSAASPVAATTSPAAASLPAPAHAAAHSGWVVQVGSYARRDFADRMVRQMKAKGFAVQVAGPDDRGLYRVRSAPYPERASAVALRQQMQQKGLKPIVNALP